MRQLSRVLGAFALALAGSVALLPGSANAAPCGPSAPTTTDCTLTGTITLAAGTLTLAAPAALSWTATLTGNTQSVVATTAAQQQYEVNDATGGGAGWHVTVSATTFTSGTDTLPNSGTFSTNGSLSSVTANTAPTATCVTTCTLPTNSVTYPVAVTTAATTPTPVTIYNAAAGTGVGDILIGGSANPNPVGWWVTVPGTAVPGTYTSTVTLAIISGP
ncbi:WxL domain-containing protein [Sphaerisporangium sp. B11E5]|uniref:WxL domain-containing protein n=1 Tax=Sphaerisporangium sp. B11E5 TaxID=3153563 RepID=UPI00325E38DE